MMEIYIRRASIVSCEILKQYHKYTTTSHASNVGVLIYIATWLTCHILDSHSCDSLT